MSNVEPRREERLVFQMYFLDTVLISDMKGVQRFPTIPHMVYGSVMDSVEISFGKYCAFRGSLNDSYQLIPVEFEITNMCGQKLLVMS